MIKGEYLSGDRRVHYAHVNDEASVLVDSSGTDKGYSATEFLAMSLASCMAATIGAKADQMGHSIEGATWKIDKSYLDNPRRLGEIMIEFDFSAFNFTEKEQVILKRVTRFCPVGHSLHPDLKQTVTYKW